MDLPQLSQPMLLLFTGVVALCESLAFVGILVPGVAILFAIALTAGQQGIALPPLLVATFAGAVVGDGLSYFLGRYAEPWLRHHWPFNRHPAWHQRGARFFQRYGPLSIVAGRFVGPIRPVIPFIAGSFDMPAGRFLLYNVVSAAAWAPAYVMPGYLIGQSAEDLLGHWRALFYPALILLLMLLVAMVLHQHLQPEQPLARWGARRLGLKPERLAALLLLTLSTAGLIVLALMQGLGWLTPWNAHLQHLLWQAAEEHRAAWVLITSFGDAASLLPAALLAALLIRWLRRTGDGWRLLALLLLTIGLNSLLKWLFQAERPDVGLHLTGFSFPSGHSSASGAFFAMLGVLLATGHRLAVRRLCYAAALIPILLIGTSRILVGAHWPLDVLGGWCEGLMAAAVLRLWLIRPQRQHDPIGGRHASLLLGALALLLGILTYWRYGADLALYQALQ